MARRPLIGVTGPGRRGSLAWTFTAWAVLTCGGRPLRMRPDIDSIPSNLDGVVIGGGDDINPVLYDEPDDQPDLYDAERDEFETEVIEYALTGRPIPLLGICRGSQLLNVTLGGTLHADIRHMRQRTSNRDTVLPLKQLHVEDDSRLAGIIGTGPGRINSLHHQAIKKSGRDLRIAARDSDGFVQAVEYTGERFLFGVQWHPEYLPYLPRQRALFRALVRAAADGNG